MLQKGPETTCMFDRLLVDVCSATWRSGFCDHRRSRSELANTSQFTATVTRKKVAGIDVVSLLGLLFWLSNRPSSSF